MATSKMIDIACRTDEQIARSAASTSIMSSARHVVGDLEQAVDPVFQGRGSRWLRRERPDEWEHLLDVLGLPEGGALTPWPPNPDEDDAWMIVCGKEARADQAAVEAALKATQNEPEQPEPVKENAPQQAPEPRRRIDWTWQDDAICKDDELLFFAPDNERPHERDLREGLAQELCSWCPVRTECLDYALARPEKYGFWGGLNEDERRTARRRLQRRAQYEAERRAVVPDAKTCGSCSVAKPAADFKRNANRPDGLAGRCRQCAAQASTPTWARTDTTEVA